VTASPPRLDRPVALTIGVFDGVHRGHQTLIRQMVEDARSRGLAAACVTFDPDPDLVVHPEQGHVALSSLADRMAALRALGVDHVEVIEFTPAVAAQTAEEFMAALGARLDVRSLWVGADFALGRERTGNVPALEAIGRTAGFEVRPVELACDSGRPISATRIRSLLAAGDVGAAAELLGRPYCIAGPVVTGMQRGRLLGFPTANGVPPPARVLPADGVYFVAVRVGERPAASGDPGASPPAPAYRGFGVVNLGARPTFDETERLLETHLLGFTGDLYGAHLEVCFLQRLRGVQRFAGVDELRAQIERDVAQATELAHKQPTQAD
jgi:riboflavin kinase/FMN adenylyltransferase